MIQLQSKHGKCWVRPEFIQAIYPLEKELAFNANGLAEIQCYVALENGDTLELIEPIGLVYSRWQEAAQRAASEEED